VLGDVLVAENHLNSAARAVRPRGADAAARIFGDVFGDSFADVEAEYLEFIPAVRLAHQPRRCRPAVWRAAVARRTRLRRAGRRYCSARRSGAPLLLGQRDAYGDP